MDRRRERKVPAGLQKYKMMCETNEILPIEVHIYQPYHLRIFLLGLAQTKFERVTRDEMKYATYFSLTYSHHPW